MALTLADIIRKRLGTAEAPAATPDATQQTAQVLGAKMGKQVSPPTGPAQTNIAEQQTAQVGQQQLQQIAGEGQLKSEQQTQQGLEQQQSFDIARQEMDQKRTALAQQARQQMGRLEQEHQQALGQLDVNRQKSAVEQAGFLSRLSNDKYITALQSAAEKQRLTNGAAIKQKLMQDAFSDELSMMKDNTAFQRVLDSDQRTFEKHLAEMDINSALAILNANLSASSQAMMAQGFGNVVSAGIEGWAKYKEKHPDEGGE